MTRLVILILIFGFSVINADTLTVLDSSEYNFPRGENIPNSLAMLNHPEIRFDPLHKDIDYELLAYSGAATLGVSAYVHIHQANAWWNEQDSKFRIINDWNYALGIDKIGHFFGTNLLAHMFSGTFEAANIQSEQATIYAAIAALAFELFIEIEDGFGPQWGFSPGDAISNTAGAAFFTAQYYFPFLKNFQPRWSYYPSEKMRKGEHKGGLLIDDYEGQKYWIGLRVKELLPKNAAEYWPSFLMISTGMGVKDLNGSGGGQREFYVGLDLDFEQLPLYGGFWGFVKNSLNYSHFPMPGFKVYPEFEFMLIIF